MVGGPHRPSVCYSEKPNLLPCKEKSFDRTVRNDSLKQLSTVLHVEFNTSAGSWPTSVVVRKQTFRQESGVFPKVKANQDKEKFVLAELFGFKAIV